MLLRRFTLRVLLPFALFGLARSVDAALGVVLYSSLDLPHVVADALRLVDAADALRRVVLWAALGTLAWTAAGALRARGEAGGLRRALAEEARGFEPLFLRPLLTVLALLSVALRPTFPYAFTLPVSLTQDWGPAQDVAALAALLAARLPLRFRLPAPRPAALGFLAFLAYAFLAPASARQWENHPGNEPKTLRMAVAVGHWLSLDVEGVSGPMEALPTRPLGASMVAAARTVGGQSLGLVRAALSGPRAVGASAIRATRITRQTVRGKDGGVFHVLAPGPSILLAPALRLDRALNLRQGTPGRLGITLVFWNALAGALVAALCRLLREATGRPGLSAALAAGLALVPPLVFYSFQFYPEMLGALALAVLFRLEFFAGRWSGRTLVTIALLLAVLPWLHQKFLPVWLVLTAVAVVKAVDQMVTLRELSALLLPQAVSAALFVLYNFAITGSVRPDALYLAWGPPGVSTARLGQGLFGLLLDARYGLLPYVPIFLLAAAGLAVSGPGAAVLRRALPVAAVYYLTVAAADNWAGAVCNLGRYVMPAVPVLAALAAVALARAGNHRGILALTLALAGWTALLARALWRDPSAANDAAVLLARSAFADGNVYLPNLFLRSWSDAAPGLVARVAVWLALLVLLAAWFRRAERGGAGRSATAALSGAVVIALLAGLGLERWPSPYRAPRFVNAVPVGPGATAFLTGPVAVQAGRAVAWSGEVEVLVRSRTPLAALLLGPGGEATLRMADQPPVSVGPGAEVPLPLVPAAHLVGRRGAEEELYRARFRLEAPGEIEVRVAATAAASPLAPAR